MLRLIAENGQAVLLILDTAIKLFLEHHCLTSQSFTFRVCSRIDMSLYLMITVVPSAYNVQNNIFDILDMSFMYVMNNR